MSPNLAYQLSLLPERLGWHMVLTAGALAAGIAVSLPLAVMAFRVERLRGPVLGVTGVVQTIPSLALLAVMVPLLGGQIGFVPAIIALILYSMLPVVRNTVTGLAGVDPALVEAARGVGMTEWQMLLRVQLPLAAPVIIAGIRTATVWVVGIATLSTPVGQVSLGNYIFEGLQLKNWVAVLIGCGAAAALALALDAMIHLLELAAARRSRAIAILALVLLFVSIAAAVAPLVVPMMRQRLHQQAITAASTQPRSDESVTVGAKTFTEQYILAQLMGRQLKHAGFNVRNVSSMGSTILFDALANSSVDCYVDYSGTIWTTVMKRTKNIGRKAMLRQVSAYLKKQYGIECVGALGFQNTYALAMPRKRAQKLHIHTIADLAAYAPQMTIGGDYEFFGRPEWQNVRKMYGLNFAQKVSMDSTLMYSAAKDGQVDVISAFSTDGRILAYDLEVLKDTKHAFPPYDAMLLVSPQAQKRAGLVEALRPLVGAIDDQLMRRMNKAVDVDHETPQQAAKMVPLQ